MQHAMDVELYIIVGLVSLIVGLVSGVLMGVHLMTRNLMYQQRTQQRRVVPARPRPQARTQVLYPDYDDRY